MEGNEKQASAELSDQELASVAGGTGDEVRSLDPARLADQVAADQAAALAAATAEAQKAVQLLTNIVQENHQTAKAIINNLKA